MQIIVFGKESSSLGPAEFTDVDILYLHPGLRLQFPPVNLDLGELLDLRGGSQLHNDLILLAVIRKETCIAVDEIFHLARTFGKRVNEILCDGLYLFLILRIMRTA